MAAQPRKLVVCCDGTWKKRDSPGAVTNVAKMARAIRPIDDSGTPQLIYYHPGVGTGNRVDQFLGGAMGVGLSSNVQSAYSFLVDNFLDGDFIFLFGFSRGAYTVRSLAGFIGLVGLVEKIDMDQFLKVYQVYRSRQFRDALVFGADAAKTQRAFRTLFPEGEKNGENKKLQAALDNSRRTNIFFVGVWDTVGSLGVPPPLSWIRASEFNFHDTDLNENIVYAYHAVAIDEERRSFQPTLWTRRKPGPHAKRRELEQVWFAGCHSNVGGGEPNAGLSDAAFLWMAAKAAAASREAGDRPLTFNEDYLKTRLDQSMGTLLNKRAGLWRLLPQFVRRVCASRHDGKETCERIHESVVARIKCPDGSAFVPYPYKPGNIGDAIRSEAFVAPLSDFEKRFRKF
ncbi:MAG: hypothetical protein QOG74_1521 [Alphaproteobacteria bacterium]|nr:hypothetical protein [Alphaproteobacteria bacterium]